MRALTTFSEPDELRLVDEKVFSSTYTRDLPRKVFQLMTADYHGIFNIANREARSWYGFAAEIPKLATLKNAVTPIGADQYPQNAKRPRFLVLGSCHLPLRGMNDISTWQEALKGHLAAKGYIAWNQAAMCGCRASVPRESSA